VQNVIILASNTPLPSKEELYGRADDTVVMNRTYILSMLDKRLETLTTDRGIVLTDDYAPVDHLYMSMLDEGTGVGSL
jgi:hypothetical protein